jgi:DNA-binding beta-propeller fold protein YncE
VRGCGRCGSRRRCGRDRGGPPPSCRVGQGDTAFDRLCPEWPWHADADPSRIPFATVTSTPGRLIKIDGSAYAIAVTPDGQTAYVSSEPPTKQKPPGCAGQTGEVTPISTATNMPGPPIRVGCYPYFLAITPDGATAWVASGNNTVTPIATATNTPGKPIKIRGAIIAIAIAPRP